MMTIAELISKLEAATEGSSWLDMDIARALGWVCPATHMMDTATIYYWWGYNWFSGDTREAFGNVRDFPFTTSVEAALRLIPAGYGYGFSFSKQYGLEAWVQNRLK